MSKYHIDAIKNVLGLSIPNFERTKYQDFKLTQVCFEDSYYAVEIRPNPDQEILEVGNIWRNEDGSKDQPIKQHDDAARLMESYINSQSGMLQNEDLLQEYWNNED